MLHRGLGMPLEDLGMSLEDLGMPLDFQQCDQVVGELLQVVQ